MTRTLTAILTQFFLLSGIFAHDLQISFFEVSSTDAGEVSLFVRLDKEDILKELYERCEAPGKVNQCLADYLNHHFRLSFDGTKTTFRVIEVNHTKEFVEVSLISSQIINPFSKIEVFNDVLIEKKEDQENIVRFKFHNKLRSFRMNKDRIETTITY